MQGRDQGRAGRNAARSSRDRVKIFGPATLLTVAGFLVAYQFVEPAPPKRITIATGRPDGAYAAYAQQYRQYLAQQGIELEILSTAGSVENLDILAAAEAEVAFVQSGVGGPQNAPNLFALGSLYFEPLWLFHRDAIAVGEVGDLSDLRVSIGGVGSGSRAVSAKLLAANGVALDTSLLSDLGGAEAAADLLSGQLDASFFVISVESPVIQELLRTEGIQLFDFTRSEAYSRVYPFLSAVVLPRGVVDFAADIPDRDVELVAPAATLVVHEDLHPALIDLLLQAADDIHGGGGVFEKAGQFPSPKFIDFPLHKEARRYFRSGPPFLQRYLPFWAATLVDRIKVMILPLLTLLIPLFKIVPPTYRWKVRSRIYRWYRELEEVDLDLDEATDAPVLDGCAKDLDRIESEVTRVTVPLSYAVELYDLRLHIAHVRRKLEGVRQVDGD